jgi:hypothetical protein
MPNQEERPRRTLRGPKGGVAYKAHLAEKVIEYAGEGFSLSQMSKMSLPDGRTLRRWKRENPEFAEDLEDAFNAYVNDKATEMMSLAETMPAVKGLKGMSKVIAIDKRIQRTLQIAASRDPSHWGKDTIGGGETIVMDLGLGTLKEINLPGSRDGQNAHALAAQVKRKR